MSAIYRFINIESLKEGILAYRNKFTKNTMSAFEYYLPESLIKKSSLNQQEKMVTTTWENKGIDPVKGACGTIMENVKISGYLQYGLYWCAVKKILLKNGFLQNDIDDERIANIYKSDSDLKTLILAYAFADYYKRNWLRGTRDFYINDTDKYVLFDEEMEL